MNLDQRPLKAGARVRVPYALPALRLASRVSASLGRQLPERFVKATFFLHTLKLFDVLPTNGCSSQPW